MSDTQGSLFGLNAYGDTEPAKHLARADDPVESKLAAAQVADKVGKKQLWAKECVEKSPGLTAMELAVLYCPTDPREIGRRLGECAKKDMIVRGASRACTVTGKQAATWLPRAT